MLHCSFSLKPNIFLEILSLRKGCFYLLSGIAITAGDQWKPEKKQRVHIWLLQKKLVEMRKLLISASKTSSFLGAMAMEWHCIFDAVFSRAY